MNLKKKSPLIIPHPITSSPLSLKIIHPINQPLTQMLYHLKKPYPLSHYKFTPHHFNLKSFIQHLPIKSWLKKKNPNIYPFTLDNHLFLRYKKNLFRGFKFSYSNLYSFFVPYRVAPKRIKLLSPSYSRTNKPKKLYAHLSKAKKISTTNSKLKFISRVLKTPPITMSDINILYMHKKIFIRLVFKIIQKTYRILRRIRKSHIHPLKYSINFWRGLEYYIFSSCFILFKKYLGIYITPNITSFEPEEENKLPVISYIDETEEYDISIQDLKNIILSLKNKSKLIKKKFLLFNLKKSKLLLKKERNKYKHLFKNKKIILHKLLTQNKKIQLFNHSLAKKSKSHPRHDPFKHNIIIRSKPLNTKTKDQTTKNSKPKDLKHKSSTISSKKSYSLLKNQTKKLITTKDLKHKSSTISSKKSYSPLKNQTKNSKPKDLKHKSSTISSKKSYSLLKDQTTKKLITTKNKYQSLSKKKYTQKPFNQSKLFHLNLSKYPLQLEHVNPKILKPKTKELIQRPSKLIKQVKPKILHPKISRPVNKVLKVLKKAKGTKP